MLTRDKERSLWLHRVVAGRLAINPHGVLDVAMDNLRRLESVHPTGITADWIARWRQVLEHGPDEVFYALTSSAEWAAELRQNSPFAGVLPEDERQAVLAAFQDHWREAHEA